MSREGGDEFANASYRSAPPVSSAAIPRAEFVYRPMSADRSAHSPLLQKAFIGMPFTVVAAAFGGAPAALAVMGVAAGWGLVSSWRSPETAGSVLRVEGEELVIKRRRRRGPPIRLRLAKLTNVVLESKGIELNTTTQAPDGRGVFARPLALDVSRIMFVVEGQEGPPVRLTEAYLSNSEGVEWLSKIRMFLRSHGWLPEEERELAPE